MKVAVDATALLGTRSGVATFTAELLEHLAASGDVELAAYAVTWRGRGQLGGVVPDGVETVSQPLPARPLRVLWKRLSLPRLDRTLGNPDVVHGPNFVVPPMSDAAAVVTVHDLTCVRFPELCSKDVLDYPTLIQRAIDRGATVHTPSTHVADEIAEHFSIEAERLATIPNGVAVVPDADPALGHRVAGSDRYVLAVGTIEPRKDHPTLVRAFDALAAEDPELMLVLAGEPGWGQGALDEALERSAHRDRVRLLGWVDEPTRAALLRGATVLAYPSVYEGFGLPPLEAMQVGVPVVATPAGAVPEVVGDAAVLVPVGDADALGAALRSVIEDDSVRTRLVEAGRARAGEFDWATTARRLVELYTTVSGS